MAFFWLVVAIAFIVAEVLTLALFAAFFAVAALGGALVAWVGGDLLAQGLTVLVLSVAGIALARPPLMRYLTRRREGPTASGAQEMVGKPGIVSDRIAGGADHERGHVRIMGESWLAVSADDSPIEAGQEVRVVEIRGATLVVKSARQPFGHAPRSTQPTRSS